MGSKNFLNMLWKFLPQLIASPNEEYKKVIYQIYNNNCLLEGEHCTIRKKKVDDLLYSLQMQKS